jgi:hypothetical protein
MKMKNKDFESMESQNPEETKLPPCQISTTAEHARLDEDDGPCDDGRGSRD